MSTDRWNRVDAVLAEALMLSPGERDEYLARACATEPEVLQEVQRLLRVADETGGFLEGGAPSGLMAAALDHAATGSLEADDAVGPYRLVRSLGQGGMGTVYLAERADGQFEQRVAIKVVHSSVLHRDELLRRFLQERQILAGLRHANIARLYDGGVTEGGQPYLVMEYVEGLQITDFCDQAGLTVDDRIRVFLDVGRAVQHAHRSLVVHRDLKPSNILVVQDTGEVKLLDFGIAKFLTHGESSGASRTANPVMTLAHAAPEQIRGEAVTTATDVYALGVLLYEMLSGSKPFPHERDSSPYHLTRAILDQDPEPPSSAVGLAGNAGAVAEARGTQPASLRRALRGDLDRICLMAMRKEPERRYASAQALVDDLGRYLGGHPVSARADTLAYRTGKFVARHRLGVVAAALAVVSLVGGLGAALWQAQSARAEAARTRQVSELVLEILAESEPDPARDGEMSARELLSRGADRIANDLAGQPALQAEMYTRIGPIFRRLGLYDEGRPVLTAAIELTHAAGSTQRHALAVAVHELGRLEQDDGNFSAADSLYRRAEASFAETSGDREDLGRVLADRARLANDRNEHAQADSLFRRAAALLDGPQVPVTERLLLDLDHAEILHILGEQEAADSLYRHIVERRADLPADRSLGLAETLFELGIHAQYRGDAERAEALLQQTLDIRRDGYGREHRAVGITMAELSAAQWALGDRDAAVETHREAVDILRQTLGPEHADYAMWLGGLGVKLSWTGLQDEAERAFREAETVQMAQLGPDHFHTAMTRRNLGRTLLRLDQPTEALSKLEAGLEGWIAARGDDAFFAGPTRVDIAQAHAQLGNRRAADSVLDVVMGEAGGTPVRGVALGAARQLRAELAREDGDLESATHWMRDAIAAFDEAGVALDEPNGTGGAWQARTAAEAYLGELLMEGRRYQEAEARLRAALSAWEAGRGPESAEATRIRRLLEELGQVAGF